MNLRENGYRVELPEGSIRPFEERILASGMCDFALDMTFSSLRESTRITYNCSGYVCLKELGTMEPKKIFEILEKTLITLNKAGEFFIDRDKILLNTETVFYNRKYKDVKLAYYPRERSQHVTQSVCAFMEDLAEQAEGKGKTYLYRVRDIYIRNNCDLRDMITVAGELRRELFLGEKGLLHEGNH